MAKKRKKDKNLPVLLLEDIPKLGQRGEIKKVKPGYFKYLLSQGKVALATKEEIEGRLKPFLLETKLKEREDRVKELKEELEKIELEFEIKVGKLGQVFSSVTKEKILKALEEKGIKISKSQIILRGKIDQEGIFEVPLNLGYGVQAKIRIRTKKGS